MGHILDIHGAYGAETRRESFYLYGPCFGGNRTTDGQEATGADARAFHVEIEYDLLPDLEVALKAVRARAEEHRGIAFPKPTSQLRARILCEIVEIDYTDRAVELRLAGGQDGWRDPRVDLDDLPGWVWEVAARPTQFTVEVNRSAQTDLAAPLNIEWIEEV